MNKKLCLIPYIGSKLAMSEWILSYLPKHQCFIEVFGGSGSLLLNKPLSDIEIYNDIDDNMVNLLMAVRDNAEEFFNKVYDVPYSRKIYEEFKKERTDLARMGELDPVDRAARFYFFKATVFSGANTGGIKTSKVVNCATNYYNRCLNIFRISERLKNVTIEKLDFKEIIKRYDGDNVLFYIDPPYWNLNYYSSEFTTKDHFDLANLLNNIKGKATVSYYDMPEIISLYPNWEVIKKDWTKHSAPLKDEETDEIKDVGKEILLLNFAPEGRLF